MEVLEFVVGVVVFFLIFRLWRRARGRRRGDGE